VRRYFDYLKLSYYLQIFFGIFISSYLIISAISDLLDNRTNENNAYLLNIAVTVVFIAIFILIPYLAALELDDFENRQKIIYNTIDSILLILTIILAPLGVLQLYTIYKIKLENRLNNLNISSLVFLAK